MVQTLQEDDVHLPRIVALVLAGGAGSRLGSLTETKAKPAMPVAGTYRLIDVSMSNLVHSHISDVWVIQQYLPHTLNEYLANGRPWDLDRSHGGMRVLPPFEGGSGEGFAQGNTDALYRQRELIREFEPDLVLVLSADHLYTLNFLDVLETHRSTDSDLTMVTTEINEDASRYGVVQVDGDGRVVEFDYKPDEPRGRLVAAEIFLFDAPALLEALDALAEEEEELADYGDDLLPWFVARRTVVEHRLTGYWMDLGTPQSYWTAHMQLLDGDGVHLDDAKWPILSAQPQLLPAVVTGPAEIADSMIAEGSTVSGAVTHSVIGVRVRIDEGATVFNGVILDGARIKDGAHVINAIVDADAVVESGTYGAPDRLTIIDASGVVSQSDALDRSQLLPQGI